MPNAIVRGTPYEVDVPNWWHSTQLDEIVPVPGTEYGYRHLCYMLEYFSGTQSSAMVNQHT